MKHGTGALPELERIGWLDVEVAVAEDGRRPVAPRCRDLADRERLTVPVDELRVAACAAYEAADPLARSSDVGGTRRIGADRRDAQEHGQLVEPLRAHRAPRLTNGDAAAGAIRLERCGPASCSGAVEDAFDEREVE